MRKYRGVEQLEARRAHNPEVVGSSPASATIKTPDFDKKSGVFLTFYANLRWLQICFGDSLGIAQNHGWEKPNFLREMAFSVLIPDAFESKPTNLTLLRFHPQLQ